MRAEDRCGVCCAVGEGTGDGGGAAGYLEPGVDVLQVLAHGFLGHVEPPGDLGVGVAGGDQAQQFPMAGGELGGRAPLAFGVEVGLVQVGAQQGQQVAVAVGEIWTGITAKPEPQRPSGPGGQAQPEHVLQSQRMEVVAVKAVW
jgi:hypothetical protein